MRESVPFSELMQHYALRLMHLPPDRLGAAVKLLGAMSGDGLYDEAHSPSADVSDSARDRACRDLLEAGILRVHDDSLDVVWPPCEPRRTGSAPALPAVVCVTRP